MFKLVSCKPGTSELTLTLRPPRPEKLQMLEAIGSFSGKHKKCINSEFFLSPEKIVGEKIKNAENHLKCPEK